MSAPAGKLNARARALDKNAHETVLRPAASACLAQPTKRVLFKRTKTTGPCADPKTARKEQAKVDRRMSNVAKSKRSLAGTVKNVITAAIEEGILTSCTRMSRISSVAADMLADIAYNAIVHVHKHATSLSIVRKGKFVVPRDISAAINMLDPALPGARLERDARNILEELWKTRGEYIKALGPTEKLEKKSTHLAEAGLRIPHFLVQRIAAHQSQAAGKVPINSAIYIGFFAQSLVLDVVDAAVSMSAKQDSGDAWTLMPAHVSRGIQSNERLRRIISDHKLLGQHSHSVAADYNVSDVILRKRGAVAEAQCAAKASAGPSRKRKASSQGGKKAKKAKKGSEASEKGGCGMGERYGGSCSSGLCSLKKKTACSSSSSSQAAVLKRALAILSDAEDESACPCPSSAGKRRRKLSAACKRQKKDAGCRKLGSVAAMLRKIDSDDSCSSSSSDSDSSSSSSDSDCKPCNRKGRKKLGKKYACLTRAEMLKKLKDAKCKEEKLKKKAAACTVSGSGAAPAPAPVASSYIGAR